MENQTHREDIANNDNQAKAQASNPKETPTNQTLLLSTNRRVYPSMGHGGRGRKIPRRESLT
jgi:hypothetical protein